MTAAADYRQALDPAPTVHACCIARSRLISSKDWLFSWLWIGRSFHSALNSRAFFWLGTGSRRRSAKSAQLRFRQRNDQVVLGDALHARFYGFETCVAIESATCLEPKGRIIRLSAD